MVEGVTMTEWLYMTHPATGGGTRMPDQPGVRERYEALGWVIGDLEDEDAKIFVPPKVVEANTEDGWVTLYHRETHAAHEFPAHPDAIQGAYEAGWQATPPKVATPDPTPVVDDSDKAPAKGPAKKASESGGDIRPVEEEELTRG
jgi:hypothetical protein